MSSLKINTLANFAGRGWVALLTVLFIPVYINVLGIECWALIGFFTTLQALLNLLDMGLSPALNRELARLSSIEEANGEQRDLTRTLEIIYWGTSALLGLIVMVAAPVVARYWIHSQDLPVTTVTLAIRLMGLIFIFQFPFALYQGGLMGLQHQVRLNGILGAMATLRCIGAVAVLWWISPTIKAFFIWQLLMSALQTYWMRTSLWKLLPRAPARPEFRKSSITGVWRFAAGMTGIALVTILLTNLDKLLLSKMLTLQEYGYYMIAASVMGGVRVLTVPFFFAAFPRLSQLVAAGESEKVIDLYHLLCQTVAVVVIPVVAVLSLFSPQVLTVWLRNPIAVQNSHMFVTLLVLGTGLNTFVNIPYALQLANGWTSLALYQNAISVVFFVPALIVAAHLYGGLGAAVLWVVLNGSWVLITPHVMHRRLLQGEKWRWYIDDVLKPSLGAATVVGVMRIMVAAGSLDSVGQFLVLAAAWPLSTVTAILLSPKVFRMVRRTARPYRHARNV